MLHCCIDGEKVGVDGSKVVDVDHHHDPCPGGVPAPPGERLREPPSFFFFLGVPPRWEESSPSDPWPPWRRRGGSPSEIGSPSLFSSVSHSPDLALHGFLNSRRSVTLMALKFYMIFSINYLSCARRRAPTDFRGGHKTPGRARGCPARPGGLSSLWPSVCVDSTSQKS